MRARCEEVLMHGGRDKPMWMLTTDRKFTVKSLYRYLIKSDVGFPRKFLRKTKVPAKIRFFLWLLARKSILTRDNLIKIGWKGDKNCVFYGKDETIDHLFFSCSVAKTIWALVRCAFDLKSTPTDLSDCFGIWFQEDSKKLIMVGVSALLWAIWRCRNNIVFSDPMGVVKMMCGWISDWAVLQKRCPAERMMML